LKCLRIVDEEYSLETKTKMVFGKCSVDLINVEGVTCNRCISGFGRENREIGEDLGDMII